MLDLEGWTLNAYLKHWGLSLSWSTVEDIRGSLYLVTRVGGVSESSESV